MNLGCSVSFLVTCKIVSTILSQGTGNYNRYSNKLTVNEGVHFRK